MEQNRATELEESKKHHEEEKHAIMPSEDDVDKIKNTTGDLKPTNNEREDVNELRKQLDALLEKLEESEEENVTLRNTLKDTISQHVKEVEKVTKKHDDEISNLLKKIEDSSTRIAWFEKNTTSNEEVAQKMDEMEDSWIEKITETEKECEKNLVQCQEINEYYVRLARDDAMDKMIEYDTLNGKFLETKEELDKVKQELDAREVSMAESASTMETMKMRLFEADSDVEKLSEELEFSKEQLLIFENKFMELSNRLDEVCMEKEELEAQFASVSNAMQNPNVNIELMKIEALKQESRELVKDRQLLIDISRQHNDQQLLLVEVQKLVTQFVRIAADMKMNYETESEKMRNQEAAEIDKAQQIERLKQELDDATAKKLELEDLIGPYRELLESYRDDFVVLKNKETDLGAIYAEILGEHNQRLKIKYLQQMTMKPSELFQKNMDLEVQNFKLTKTVEKQTKQLEDMCKPDPILKKAIDNKENS